MPVEFPEEKYNRGAEFEAPKTPTMVKWAMKTGLVKDETQANYALIGLAILFFALTWWVIAGGSSPAPKGQITYIEDLTAEQRAELPPEVLESLPSRTR